MLPISDIKSVDFGNATCLIGSIGVKWVEQRNWMNFANTFVHSFHLGTTARTTFFIIVNVNILKITPILVQGLLFPAIDTTHFTATDPSVTKTRLVC